MIEMKKATFEKIQKNYELGRERLEGLVKCNLVWKTIPRFEGFDYHPAMIKKVNVDEDFVVVIDVSDGNKEKIYNSFVTQEEMIENHGFTEEIILQEYKKYSDIRTKIIDGEL